MADLKLTMGDLNLQGALRGLCKIIYPYAVDDLVTRFLLLLKETFQHFQNEATERALAGKKAFHPLTEKSTICPWRP